LELNPSKFARAKANSEKSIDIIDDGKASNSDESGLESDLGEDEIDDAIMKSSSFYKNGQSEGQEGSDGEDDEPWDDVNFDDLSMDDMEEGMDDDDELPFNLDDEDDGVSSAGMFHLF
jgi:hypothetical protein